MAEIKENVDNKVEQETSQQEPIEEKTKTFTQEDYDKFGHSSSQKGKNEILKTLGIENVNEFKKQQETFLKWQEENKTEAEKQIETIKKLTEAEKQWGKKELDYKTNLASLKGGVKAEYLDKVSILAKDAMTKDDTLNIEDAITKVLTEIPTFSNSDNKVNIKFGVEKSSATKNNVNKVETDFMKAFGIKPK